MRNISYPCRIYAFEMNLSGKDDYRFQSSANSDQELFKSLCKIRDDFHDTYRDLDKYVYLTDENENMLHVSPSSIMRRLGDDREKARACQIGRKCKYCYHMTDVNLEYCRDFGLVGCERYISVNDYWKSPEGKRRIEEQKEEERKYWEKRSSDKREHHELSEEFFNLFSRWAETPECKRKNLDSKMDKMAARLKELCETLGEEFIDWREY